MKIRDGDKIFDSPEHYETWRDTSRMAYSVDGWWYFDFDEVEQILKYEFGPGEHVVYCGIRHRAKHSDFIFVNNILDQIKESAWNEHEEFAEGYLENLKSSDMAELGEIIADFLTERTGEPSFYSVYGIKRIRVQIDED